MSVDQATAPMMSEGEFVRLWKMGFSSDRSMRFDGSQEDADDFFRKFANLLAGMPGDSESILDDAEKRKNEITHSEMSYRQWVMANGVMKALRSMCGGKAVIIVRNVQERGNGLEAWRRLVKEYRPSAACHNDIDINRCSKKTLLKIDGIGRTLATRVIESRPFEFWDDVA